MNLTLKKTIAFILMICTLGSTLLLSSCSPDSNQPEDDFASKIPNAGDNYFPEWYTGGFGIGSGEPSSYYWVETYEECQAAIELLKSHGSTFSEKAIFTYEGDLFDTKYCFYINRNKAEYIPFGDNPFDRKAEDVRVTSYAFCEDITIDELIRSYISSYQSYFFYGFSYSIQLYKDNPGYDVENLYYKLLSDNYTYNIYEIESDEFLFQIKCVKTSEKRALSEEAVEAIIGTIVVVH